MLLFFSLRLFITFIFLLSLSAKVVSNYLIFLLSRLRFERPCYSKSYTWVRFCIFIDTSDTYEKKAFLSLLFEAFLNFSASMNFYDCKLSATLYMVLKLVFVCTA